MKNIKSYIIKFYITFILIVLALVLCSSTFAATETLETTNFYSNTDRVLTKDELSKIGIYDESNETGNYEIKPGASLLKSDINTLVFEITLKNESLKEITNVDYIFKIGTGKANGTSLDLGFVILLSIDGSNNGIIGIGRKNTNWKENVSLYGYDYDSNTLDTTKPVYEQYSMIRDDYKKIDNYTFEKESFFDNDSPYINYVGENELKLYIQIETTSVYNYYFMSYSVFDSYNSVDYYTGVSSLVSVHDVLTQINTLSSFESELDASMVDTAYYLVNDSTKRDVIVEYLERIDGTPFAIKKQSKIIVPVMDNSIKASDVANALGYKNMGVMQSYCGDFVYDAEKGIYTTQYQKSIWLSAKTVDGNSVNYFLDCNLSYQDYYYQFVKDGIFTNDLYEYIFNKMQLDYPVLSSYKPNEIYGYFGFVSIPNTYSINALWEEMFGSNKTFDGLLFKYCFTEDLLLTSYTKLLDEYQYNWLEIAWNDCAGLFTGGSWSADNYLFYADCETNQAFIAENGADNIEDNDGLIKNDVEDIIENLGLDEMFEKIMLIVALVLLIMLLSVLSPVLNVLKMIFKGIWFVLTLPFKLIGKLFKRKKY